MTQKVSPASTSFSMLPTQGTGATSIFLQVCTWVRDPELKDDFRRFCIVWPYSIKQVSDLPPLP